MDYKILSIFSGGGLLDLGFLMQGFEIVEAVENYEPFVRAYNFSLSKFINSSKISHIKNGEIKFNPIIEPLDLTKRSVQSRLAEKYKNRIIGLVGGPPCQDYSVGGKNLGIKGKRGQLIHSYYQIIKNVNPKFFFFENVEGLFKTNLHRVSFINFVKKLENLEYETWYSVINALEYGIPQDRPRLLLVGFKKELVARLVKAGYVIEKSDTILKHKSSKKFVFKWPTVKYRNLKSANQWPQRWKFGSVTKRAEVLKLERKYKSVLVKNAFKGLNRNTPNQKEFFNPYSDKFFEIDEGNTYRKSFKRLHRYRFSPTVAYGNNEVHLHPTKPRRLTVREALRLQSVPDSYILPEDVTLTDKFKLISNGVPTKKASLIAKEIKRTLINYTALKSNGFGHLDKKEKKRSDVKNQVEKHKARKTTSFRIT